MSDVITEMIDHVWQTPRGAKLKRGGRKNPDNHQYYRKWGFPIYRTYYGKESDEHWQSLLYCLRHQTKLAFGRYEGKEEIDQDDRRTVQELFHLDVREDVATLDGLDIRGLRELCKVEKSKETKLIMQAKKEIRVSARPLEGRAMTDYLFDFVLLADKDVLRDLARGEYIVKAVSFKWNRHGGWGWMRIPTGYLLDLWTFLMWNNYPESCLRFRESEEDLENHIWCGDAGLECTGNLSEIRPFYHYDTQKEYDWASLDFSDDYSFDITDMLLN
ncbi:hypothetical protein HYE67_000023 [Fusarium culmorum]|jgi:hypothetical protein|uniref:Uncharacterized protein n=1 Tax=Fusarium culmorum TaxID=5516 RepID=A0A7S8HQV4_FUSCU|nr:hypothetical protein HYE67_000023 [Fusarium culmorum]